MGKRVRNISDEVQTLTIVRANQTIVKTVHPLHYVIFNDEEYSIYLRPKPPLNKKIWQVTEVDTDVPQPPVTPVPGVFSTDDIDEGELNKFFTTLRARLATIDDFIVPGVQDKAPSQNAVYNALQGKLEDAINVGTGAGNVLKGKAGQTLQFRRLRQGAGIVINQSGDSVVISSVGSGAPSLSVTTQSANYEALDTDNVILVNALLAPVTVILPPAAQSFGKFIFIKKIDESENIVTIQGNLAGELIDNANTFTNDIPFASFGLTSDGSNWWII